MEQTRLKWSDLELLLVLHRGGSISLAAAEVGVQQSTLTRRLKDFEERMGVAAFVRTPEGVVLTPFGESLIAPAIEAELGVRHAQKVLNQHEGRDLSGEVTIATLFTMSDYFLAPELADFHKRYPDIRLKIVPSAHIADLTRLEADIATRFVRPMSGELVVKKMVSVVQRPTASSELSKQLASVPLEHWPWLGLTKESPDIRKIFKQRSLTPVFSFSSATTMIEAIRAGAGVGMLGTHLAERLGLVGLNAPKTFTNRASIWLVTHKDLRKTPTVDAVWNWLLDGAQN